MPIVDTVSQSDFRDAFQRYGRINNFTYNGLDALHDYLEELSDDIGEPIEMDVIAFCSEYDEGTAQEIATVYPSVADNLPWDDEAESENAAIDKADPDDLREAVIEYLNDNTTLCAEVEHGNGHADTFLYVGF